MVTIECHRARKPLVKKNADPTRKRNKKANRCHCSWHINIRRISVGEEGWKITTFIDKHTSYKNGSKCGKQYFVVFLRHVTCLPIAIVMC